MSSQSTSKAQLWGGRVASALPVIALAMSAAMKLSRNAELASQFVGKLGYPESSMVTIGVVELVCTILYAIPRTSVLGAVLITGYLGGAIATHLRIGEPYVAAIVLGVLVWAGLFLRDQRLRALLPLRKVEAA